MLYVCVRGVMVVFSWCLYCDACRCRCLCMGRMSVWHAYVVCLCLVCIMW